MATISGDLKTKFTDDLGEPLVGGKVYTYHAGTSTPKDSYQDKAFAVVNTNPIVLDDAGSCDLYLNGLYRLRVLDKDGVFVEERDYMTQGDSTGSSITDNANNITVLQSEVQAINERSVLKLDEHNFIIAHGRADSATVYDPVFRADKLKLALQGQEDSARNIFKTYATDTTLNGNEIKAGTYLDPELQAVKLGTAASRLVGTATGQVPLVENVRNASLLGTGISGAVPSDFDNHNTVGVWRGETAGKLNAPLDLSTRSVANVKFSMLMNRDYASTSFAGKKQEVVYLEAPYTGRSFYRVGENYPTTDFTDWIEYYTTRNTTKDSKTNLLLESGDSIPSNSAASRLVGTANGQIPLAEQVSSLLGTAATKNVGTANGQIPLAQNVKSLALSGGSFRYSNIDFNSPNVEHLVMVEKAFSPSLPSAAGENNTSFAVITFKFDGAGVPRAGNMQFAVRSGQYGANGFFYRAINSYGGSTSPDWIPITTMKHNYHVTTGTAPNVVIESDGTLKRSTSSEKYKNIIASLELNDEDYQKALAVKPIVYRSKADGDPDNWHYMSFSAEQLGAYDPCLTQWKTHDTDPETGERIELEQKEAEGINLNAICAVLHATNIYQDKKLKELEQRLTALESNNEPIE